MVSCFMSIKLLETRVSKSNMHKQCLHSFDCSKWTNISNIIVWAVSFMAGVAFPFNCYICYSFWRVCFICAMNSMFNFFGMYLNLIQPKFEETIQAVGKWWLADYWNLQCLHCHNNLYIRFIPIRQKVYIFYYQSIRYIFFIQTWVKHLVPLSAW